MPRNIEIKATVGDFEALLRRAERLPVIERFQLTQDDTFFHCGNGRLKLRQTAAGRGELIFYRRADAAGPTPSFYTSSSTDQPESLRETLALAMGIRGRVRKHRIVLRVDRTRIHLDRVEGLGTYLEIEVGLMDGEDASVGLADAREMMDALGVRESALVEGAYIDLLETLTSAAPRAPASGSGTS